MDFIVTIVGSLVTEGARCTISSIKNRKKYLSNLENNVQSLNDEVNKLKVKRGSVQDGADAAKRNGEIIESNVDNWLTVVNEKIPEVEEFIQSYEQQAKQKCFVGLCPNLKARYKFSMKAEEEANAVANLLENGNFDRISYPAPLQDIMTFSNKDFKAFESRRGVLNGIMDALKEAGISIIGVHGMGGVGKTTLVKEVARQVKESKLFDSVVFIEVRRTADVENIQKQILDFLGLKFDEVTIEGRAIRLQEKLKQKNILVVLDDIWAPLDLERVGIPSGDAQGGLKLLLTSRDLNVLSDGMDSKNNFSISSLREEEAWDLFQKMADNCVQSRDLQPIAIEVARKCAGLPIAIATVARALRNKKSSYEWENALRELKKPSPRRFTGATTGEVYSAIQLSYEYLQTEEDKLTFLLCSTIGHNGSIEDLLRYTMGLGLYDGINKINEGRNKVLSVVNTLKASCLLLDSYDDEHFDIHDVVWDVSISIASRDHGMLVQQENDVGLKELRSKEILQNCKMIALSRPDIRTELPNELECPNLSFFFMGHQGSLKIPSDFFTQTKRLKVLRLTRMLLPTLPVSISFLHNLQTLCLDRCTLKDITVVRELKTLETLSLARSDIQALPKEMAQLTQLKLLDLSHCTELEIIPPNVLSRLLELEELYLEDSFVGWKDEVVGNESRNASLEELNCLSNLTTLYLDISVDQRIPEWLLEKNIDRYRIFNGYMDGFKRSKYSKMLKLQLYTNFSSSCAMKMLVKNTEFLFLESLKGVKNVLGEVNIGKDFPYLKKLYIQKGSDVEFITTEKIEFSQLEFMTLKDLPRLMGFCYEQNTSQQGEEGAISKALPLFNKQYAFPRLKELELRCINVRSIWQSQLPEMSDCISNLTRLIISDCNKLEHLFSPCVARCLQQLKQFEIEGCKCLREIISLQEMEIEENKEIKAVICFPQLISLKIKDLRHLIRLCSGNYTIEFPLLKELEINGCSELEEFISSEPKMQALFNQKVAIPNLEKMSLSQLRNVKMIFQNELVEGSFCKLEKMRVQNCSELLTIFPSNISFRVFQNLKKLSVQDCDSLEVIFEVGEETHVIESQLKDIQILYSRGLKQVWNKDPLETLSFQSLSSVDVWRCESLKNVFPTSIAKNLPQLENLSVESCGVKEIVWEGQNSEEQLSSLSFKFPRLSSLCVKDLQQLKSLHGSRGKHAIVFDWPMLKRLDTDYSTLLEMVSSQHQDMNEQAESVLNPFPFLQQVIFPKLEELCLSNFKDAESAKFLVSLLQRFDSLESLQLSHCDLKDVVDVVDAGITKLKLDDCQNLKLLSSSCLQNLTTLEVINCGRMINLVTASSLSSSSFQNLTTLEVSYCDMMINLVTASVAQNLLQLTTMKIESCEAMTEIVAKEGDDEDGSTSIIFSKLKSIHLEDLQSLTSFCGSLNYTFEFPSLEECIVEGCPSMKVFCHGVLSTPCLHRVREWNYDDSKGHWGGELNTTIKQMYAEKVGYRNVFGLKLSDKYPELMKIWNERNSQFNFKQLSSIEFCGCNSLKYGFTSSIVLSLNLLWKLEVKECINMEQVIWDERHEVEETTYNDIMFSNLNYVNIGSCANLQSFYLGSDVQQFPNIETMEIKDCPKMMRFISNEKKMRDVNGASGSKENLHHVDLNIEAFFHDKFECPQLQTLELSSLNIHKIWSDQLQLPTLIRLKVESCHNLNYLFQSLMVREFLKLECLEIRHSESLEEVISMEGLTEEESMSFPALKKLTLEHLPKLTRFCSQNNLEVDKSVFFNEKVVFPSLEKLKVNGIGDFRKIWPNQLSVHSFCELQEIEIESCAMLLNIFPFNMMERITRLEKLQIVNCGSVEEIFDSQILVSTQSIETQTVTKFMFPRVKYLRFDKLPNLKSFYSSKHATEWPSLKTLMVIGCPKVEILASKCHGLRETLRQSHIESSNIQQPLFWMNQSTFPCLGGQLPETSSCISSLTRLIIECCDNLELLLSPSIAECLVQLKDFEIRNCKCLKEIISKREMEIEAGEQKVRICLPRLACLIMEDLPNLIEFCSENCTIEFPSLIVLEIQDCPELHELVSSEPKMQALFNQKVAIPSLEWMTLSNLKYVKTIFHNDLLKGSFCKLEGMTIEDCDELLTIFPSSISFRVFQNLEKLEVRSCDSLEMIFAVGEETSAVKSQLIDLSIVSAPKLKHIWSKDPQGILIFQSLSEVEVSGCENLKNVFPASIAKNLPQLENLSIECCGVEEIVWEGEVLNLEEQPLPLPLTFKFPRLSSLQLRLLKQLKCFYGSWGKLKNRVVLEWPMLKSLDIDYSTLQKIEASQRQQTNEEAQSMQSPSHPFSFIQQVIPKLEELCLSDVKNVECVSSLQIFPSLKSLQLYDCDFKDVGVVDTGTLSRIQKLELSCCLNLKQLGLNFGFSASSSSSSCFQNLTTLEVYMCEMMVNLITASVAQNLVHLTTMNIKCCIAMTEIVENEGDEDGSTSIIFSKLTSLDLCDLPSLTSFCSGNYTFNFPSLEELTIRGCPNLWLFCHGVLSTPFLQMVTNWKYDSDEEDWDGGEECWAGDLNSTIIQMYTEKLYLYMT